MKGLMPASEDTLTEVAEAISEASEALTRAAETVAGAMQDPDPSPTAKPDDPQSLAADVNRGY